LFAITSQLQRVVGTEVKSFIQKRRLQNCEMRVTSDVERQRDHVTHQIARGEMIKESEVEAPGDIDIQVSLKFKVQWEYKPYSPKQSIT
jgi:hypothetical protein